MILVVQNGVAGIWYSYVMGHPVSAYAEGSAVATRCSAWSRTLLSM